MLELILFLQLLIKSPITWGILFTLAVVPQFLLARRLHHQHPWFAFVPLLQIIQWLQMGRVSVLSILVLIPLLSVWFVPVFGPTNLQIIMITLKVVFLLQLGLFLFYYYLQAAVHICLRSGERRSFVIWFAIPVVNVLALTWLALKKQFWVKEASEVEVIQKLIKNLDEEKTVDKLKDFALKQGFNKCEFEILSDKALTVENNHLVLSNLKSSFPKWINLTALGFYTVLLSLIFNTVLQQSSLSFENTGLMQTEVQPENNAPQIDLKGVKRPERKPVMVSKTVEVPKEFVFLMQVNDFTAKNNHLVFDGPLVLGDAISRLAQQFYLLDKDFKLIDSAWAKGVSGLFGKFRVEVESLNNPEAVAYIAETSALRAINSLGEPDYFAKINQVPLMVITGQNRETSSQNQELKVNVLRGQLNKTDNLYVFDRSLNLVNTAEIIYLIDPSRNSVDSIKPTQGVELVLEFAREYSGKEAYLTPLKEIEQLKDYLEVLNL